MKKTDPHRPEAMQYFDEIANLFGQRPKEILAEKERGKKVVGYMCPSCSFIGIVVVFV